MIAWTIPFILSQILVFFAMGTDFLSMQFKERKKIYFTLVFSAAFIAAHLFLLGKTTAGLIVTISVLRFLTCMFTTQKRYLLIFLLLNTGVILFNYSEIYDLIIYTGLTIFIIGNFIKRDQLMRQVMMVGTATTILYYILIFSPMAILAESIFLVGHIVGYYRHHLKK